MWKTLLTAAVVAAYFISFASAETRIDGDPGGNVSSYIQKYNYARATGERIVIDGPCASACTLLTGLVPRDHVCVTSRALLAFHAASYYDDAKRELVPTRDGTRYVKSLYPASVRNWIDKHGGLTPKLIVMRGADLQRLYALCR